MAGSADLPEASPDGQFAAHGWLRNSPRSSIRVVRIDDGAAVPFEIPISFRRAMTLALLGRARWMPDGRAIAFVGQDENGVTGVYAQDFVPGRDTSATRRRLAGFDPDHITESFGIAPDGSRLVIAEWDQVFSIMLADGVPGVAPPARREQ